MWPSSRPSVMHAYYADRTRPLGHWLVTNIHRLHPLAARFARPEQLVQRERPFAAPRDGELRRHRPPPQSAGVAPATTFGGGSPGERRRERRG